MIYPLKKIDMIFLPLSRAWISGKEKSIFLNLELQTETEGKFYSKIIFNAGTNKPRKLLYFNVELQSASLLFLSGKSRKVTVTAYKELTITHSHECIIIQSHCFNRQY